MGGFNVEAISTPSIVSKIVEQSAKKYGNKTAFKTVDEQFTFREVQENVNRISKNLLSLGLKKGDVISVQLPNCIEFALIHLAAAQIGVILNPLSPRYRQQELYYMLDHCQTKALVVSNDKSNELEENAYDVKGKLSKLDHVIVVGERCKYEESIPFSYILNNSDDDDIQFPKVNENDPILIMFTSGTESNPKAVLHTYKTFVSTHLQNGYELQLDENDKMYCLTPLCHMFSLPMIVNGFYHGALHYIYDDFNVSDVIDDFINEKISFVVAAPAHLIDILHGIDNERANQTKLRLILTGGTKIPSQLVQDLRKTLNCTVAAQWGMTEICAGTFTRPEDEPSKTWKTVGRACPFGEVVIVDDETGEVLPKGETGEIAFKGASLFIEYYRNPDITKNSFTKDGYFLTGDNGYLDDDGYLYFVGRTKDIINRGGLKYHTSEIEEALLMHPLVNQVAIVSVPDSRLGERACAYISLRNEGEKLALENVQDFLLNKGFAKYKLPEFVEILTELPQTSTGKVNKVLLRDKAKTLKKE